MLSVCTTLANRRRAVVRPWWLLTVLSVGLLSILFAPRAIAQVFGVPVPGISNAANYEPVAQRYYQRRRYYPRRRYGQRRKRIKAPKVTPAWYPDPSNKDPVQIIVSLAEQKARIYQGDKVLTSTRVSSGKKGHSTPTGVFSILAKKRWHRSNIYSGAPMPFMQRLTWSGIALHASDSVPDRPASHGCVRLPNSFAPQLFNFTSTGVHVVITNNPELTPSEVAHRKLFQPYVPPPQDNDALEAERQFAASGANRETEKRSTEPVRILVTRRTGRERLKDVQTVLNELQFGAGDVDGYMGPDTAKAIKRFQRTYKEAFGLPVDGLVSDDLITALYRAAGRPAPRNGHVYVRQNFKQLFDAPAQISDPDVPLGDHLLTVQHFEPGEENARWLYVTLGAKPVPARQEAAVRDPKTASDEIGALTPVPIPPSNVRQALDRIEIPSDVRRRIETILTPGSSVAISDSGLSKETFPKGTDFVLLTDE